MRPVLHEAAAFLSALDGRTGWNAPQTFQTLDDRKEGRPLIRTLHGSLTEHADELVYLNERGAGVFVTINRTDGTARRAENVLGLRAVFIDADGPMSRGFALPPTMVIQSAAGIHGYWVLWQGEPVPQFTPTQKQLARFYGTDPSVNDLPRVMRLPGFFHQKRDPFLVTIAESHPHRAYGIEQIQKAHPVQEGAPIHTLVRDGGSFARWAQCHEVVIGARNRTAFSIAAEGFHRGIPEPDVAAVVTEWCRVAGIPSEANTVIKSARRYDEKRRAS